MRHCDGSCRRSRDERSGGGLAAPFRTGALAALGALYLVRKRAALRPYLRLALRELIAFKEWLVLNAEEARADFEDIAAEAQDAYEKDLERRVARAQSGLESLQKLSAQAKRGKG